MTLAYSAAEQGSTMSFASERNDGTIYLPSSTEYDAMHSLRQGSALPDGTMGGMLQTDDENEETLFLAPPSGAVSEVDSVSFSSIVAARPPDVASSHLPDRRDSSLDCVSDTSATSSGFFRSTALHAPTSVSGITITESQMSASSFGSFQIASDAQVRSEFDLTSSSSFASLSSTITSAPEASSHLRPEELPSVEPPAQYAFTHSSQDMIQFAHYKRYANVRGPLQASSVESREATIYEFQRRVNKNFDSAHVCNIAVCQVE
jgi:hypothetical protein